MMNEETIKTPQKLPIIDGVEIDNEQLKGLGYPLRYRRKLKDMYGPSLEAAKTYLPLAIQDDALIILHGEHGVGKTQIATWLACQRMNYRQTPGIYAKHIDILCSLKRGEYCRIHERYIRTPYLVLDDFCETGVTASEMEQSIDIINKRYDLMVGTILILTPEQGIRSSIFDRAKETGAIIHCDWPSYIK